MKKTILGFGQVLWDLTVEVDYPFLQDVEIEKGGHKRVDYEVITDIIKRLEGLPDTTIFKNPGGSTANIMSNLAKFGSNASFCGKHGDDEDGWLYMQILKEDGVEPVSILDKEKATGQLFCLITPDKDRTFIVHWGASEILQANAVSEKIITNAEVNHIEGYLVINSQDVLWKIFENAQKTTFDLAAHSVIEQTLPTLQKMMKKYPPYVLFANQFEGKAFTNLEKPKEVLDKMLDFSENAVLTLGENGALVKTASGEEHFQEAIPTTVVDTTGAGDAFIAGFLHEFLKDGDIQKAAKLGTKAASCTIKEMGARSFQKEKL